jgi:tryptophanyl-tRNA synthetase
MSASIDSSAIFMTDTPNNIKNKINRFAFSGGQTTVEEQRRLGGNPDVDVSYQYLTFFMDDDAKLKEIGEQYRKGELLTGELKQICIEHLQAYVAAFQERRVKATDEVVALFMTKRPLKWKGNPRVQRVVPVTNGTVDAPDAPADGKLSKNQLKKLEKEKQIAAKRAAKEKEKGAAN